MAQVYYEDVETGQELPTLSRKLNVTDLVMGASATRDYQPMHHDREFAQKVSKTKDIFINTQFNMGMMCRAITDWSGPKGFITKLDFTMRKSIYPGDTMNITGKVTGKRVEDGKNLVDVDLLVSNDDGPTTPANVTIQLPLKA